MPMPRPTMLYMGLDTTYDDIQQLILGYVVQSLLPTVPLLALQPISHITSCEVLRYVVSITYQILNAKRSPSSKLGRVRLEHIL